MLAGSRALCVRCGTERYTWCRLLGRQPWPKQPPYFRTLSGLVAGAPGPGCWTAQVCCAQLWFGASWSPPEGISTEPPLACTCGREPAHRSGGSPAVRWIRSSGSTTSSTSTSTSTTLYPCRRRRRRRRRGPEARLRGLRTPLGGGKLLQQGKTGVAWPCVLSCRDAGQRTMWGSS
eukprot:COSAG01_NODE_2896_length_6894_cov_4.250147_8_plen_176_part_00